MYARRPSSNTDNKLPGRDHTGHSVPVLIVVCVCVWGSRLTVRLAPRRDRETLSKIFPIDLLKIRRALPFVRTGRGDGAPTSGTPKIDRRPNHSLRPSFHRFRFESREWADRHFRRLLYTAVKPYTPSRHTGSRPNKTRTILSAIGPNGEVPRDGQ